MENLSSENIENTQLLGSNVELILPGIDKKWVRANGSWMDKSKLPVIQSTSFPTAMETEHTPSHWWQFWKA
jgi:hypothetical protein